MEKKKYQTHDELCAYNDGVVCDTRNKCKNCGFRPAVQERRLAAIKEKMDAEAVKKAQEMRKKKAKSGDNK